MWKALYCATWCALVYAGLHTSATTSLIYQETFEDIEFDYQILSFALLGLLCALLAGFFVKILAQLGAMRRRKAFGWFSNRFQYTAAVCIIVSSVTYSTDIFLFSDREIFNEMFYLKVLDKTDEFEWTEPSLFIKGVFFVFAKILITALSLSCPIPCGVFTPTFTAGAVFGRLYGEFMNMYFQTSRMGVYSLIGAAAFTGSVTHTLSVAVIVFELTGQLSYLVYMLVAVLVAFGVSFSLNPSIFDVMLLAKGLPYLPTLKTKALYRKNAKLVMDTRVPYLYNTATMLDLFDLFREGHLNMEKIPVVDNGMNLLGDVDVAGLRKEMRHEVERQINSLDAAAQEYFKSFTDALLSTSSAALEDNRSTLIGGIPLQTQLIHSQSVEKFWRTRVNFDAEGLNLDVAPITVAAKTQMVKIHFLFLMLGLHFVYVVKRGQLIGVITRDQLIKFKK